MAFVEGYKKWVPFYVFALIALLMFFVKKWMMKRMEKHMEYLNSKGKQ
jgi:preprotein translocase subunit YajC